MTKYLFLYRTPKDTQRKVPSPAEMQEMMGKFNAWRAKFAAEIADIGDGLSDKGAVVRPSGVTDGPYIEGKEVIGGYMMVATETLEHAIQICKEMPMMQPDAVIEIRALQGRPR